MSQNYFSNQSISYILVTNFDDYIKNMVENDLRGYTKIWFNYDSILLEHIEKILDEVYLSEEFQKYIIIETKKMSVVTQNSLLKLFEEPPKNITFILIVPSKSILLPTITSRLPIKNFHHLKKNENNFNINIPQINGLNLHILNKFLRELKNLKPLESKILVEDIFKLNIKYNFTSSDLERFSVASQLLNLHSNPSRVFLMLLLPFVFVNR